MLRPCLLLLTYLPSTQKNITPRYEFGFGLSYTKFKYSDIDVKKIDGSHDQNADLEANWAKSKPGPHGVGSSTALWLHRPAYNVSFTIQNVGDVYGGEVRTPSSSPARAFADPNLSRTRFRNCTSTTRPRRRSLRPSCVASPTSSSTRARRSASSSRSRDTTCPSGTSWRSRGVAPRAR